MSGVSLMAQAREQIERGECAISAGSPARAAERFRKAAALLDGLQRKLDRARGVEKAS
jgi:flagellin-specific chaperone FliS